MVRTRYPVTGIFALVSLTAFPSAVIAQAGWTDLGGGDHGGEDWTPADGSFIAGVHTNIGTFRVASGTTVYIQPWNDTQYGEVDIWADTITIEGTLNASGRGYGGGAGGSNDSCCASGAGGASAGTGGNGGNGGNNHWGCGGNCCGAGGGGGAPNGTGGTGSTGAAPNGTPAGGGNGANSQIGAVGGNGGTGPGGGGGGGGGQYAAGGGGGGGGSGGGENQGNTGGTGGGPFGGTGSQCVSANVTANGDNGGYLAAESNGDTSTDASLERGSGGGGGGSSTNGGYGGGGPGGGAGGGIIRLRAWTSLTITASGIVESQGSGGGQFGGPTFSSYYAGGGAGGGILLDSCGTMVIQGIVDNRGREANTLSTTNGGTVKLRYHASVSITGSIQAGRLHDGGPESSTQVCNEDPTIPVGLSPVDVDASVPYQNGNVPVTFEWTVSTDPEGSSVTYEIDIAYDGGFTTLEKSITGLTDTSTLQNLAISGLPAERYWRVRARDFEGQDSDWSDTYHFRMVLDDGIRHSGGDCPGSAPASAASTLPAVGLALLGALLARWRMRRR